MVKKSQDIKSEAVASRLLNQSTFSQLMDSQFTDSLLTATFTLNQRQLDTRSRPLTVDIPRQLLRSLYDSSELDK